jgi:hypothetical protein
MDIYAIPFIPGLAIITKMRNRIFISALIILISSCGQVNEKSQTEIIKEGKIQPEIKQVETKKTNIERWFEPSTLDTTFTLKDNIRLNIQLTDSIYVPEYFLDNKTLDSISNTYNNWHLRSLAIEKYLLKKNKNYTKRDTSGLFIKMKNGEWTLISLDPMTDEVDNTFEHYFKDYGYYSVRTQWGEGNGYKLINDLTGEITNLFGRPYFSPNRQYIISVNADIEAGYSENGFQLFENNKGRLLHLGNYEPSNWGLMKALWIDNNTLKTENVTTEVKDGISDYLYFYSKIKIVNGG